MVWGESCLKPPTPKQPSAELFMLALFKAMFKPETALLCWGKLQQLTLLLLWQGDKGTKGESCLLSHMLRYAKPLWTQSPAKPLSILNGSCLLCQAFTGCRFVQAGLLRLGCSQNRQQVRHGWDLICTSLGAVSYPKTQLSPGPAWTLINTTPGEPCTPV